MKFKIRKIDLFLLAVLVFSITFYFHNRMNVKSSADSQITADKNTVILYSKTVLSDVAMHVKEGDPVFDLDTGINMGVVKKIEILPEENYNSSSSGELIFDPREGFNALKLEVQTQGVISQTGLVISNYNYSIGKTFNITAGICFVESVRAMEFRNGD